jgi:hypothetical protein
VGVRAEDVARGTTALERRLSGVMSGEHEPTNSMNRDTSTMSFPTNRIVSEFTLVTMGR